MAPTSIYDYYSKQVGPTTYHAAEVDCGSSSVDTQINAPEAREICELRAVLLAECRAPTTPIRPAPLEYRVLSIFPIVCIFLLSTSTRRGSYFRQPCDQKLWPQGVSSCPPPVHWPLLVPGNYAVVLSQIEWSTSLLILFIDIITRVIPTNSHLKSYVFSGKENTSDKRHTRNTPSTPPAEILPRPQGKINCSQS